MERACKTCSLLFFFFAKITHSFMKGVGDMSNIFNMVFNVLTQYHETALKCVSSNIRMNGCKVIDLREAEIRRDSDDSKVDDVYILVCSGNLLNYLRLKMKYRYDTIMYEGRKTLL